MTRLNWREMIVGSAIVAASVLGSVSAQCCDREGTIASEDRSENRDSQRFSTSAVQKKLCTVQDPPSSQDNSTPLTNPPPPKIRFSFDGATLEQVLEFFSQETGLPIVRETNVPTDVTIRYHAPESYELPEALRVLNILLQTHNIMLRVDNEKLYLQKLEAMVKENIPTYQGTLPEEVTDDQIVVNVIPLQNALAGPLAKQLAGMVAEYGSVTAMDAQNSIVIVETAGKIRQLAQLITELDQEDPQGVIQIFKVKNLKASELLVPLKGLLAERVQKYVINPNDQSQMLVEEQELRGLSMTADDRSNSIVAKGIQSRLDQLEEAIALLDIPAEDTGRIMRTWVLSQVKPSDAAKRLVQLFKVDAPKNDKKNNNKQAIEEPEPKILPFDETSKITVVGSENQVAEAAAILAEMDPGLRESGGGSATAAGTADNTLVVVPLEHARSQPIIEALTALLNPRQSAVMRIVPGIDNQSIIINGPKQEVEMVRAMLPALDRSETTEPHSVRLFDLAEVDSPIDVIDRAKAIYDKQVPVDRAGEFDLEVDLNESLASAIAIGSVESLDLFSSSLQLVQQHSQINRERRLHTLEFANPAEIVATLESLISELLDSADGPPPTINAIESIDAIVINATPNQHAAISPVILNLDRPTTEQVPPLRILQLRTADAQNFASVLMEQYNQRSAEEKRTRPVNITADPNTNALIVAAHPELLREVEAVVASLNDVNATDAEGREIRIFPLKVARAEELAKIIDDMYPAPEPLRDRRGNQIPGSAQPREIVVRADTHTNSLIVDATSQRMAGFEKLVEQLDREQMTGETEIRTYPIEHADLEVLADALRELRDAGTLAVAGDQRGSMTISTEPVSRMLVVSGPVDVFPQVEQVLQSLDVKPSGPTTSLKFFKLTHARADVIAPMLREILVTRVVEELVGTADAESLLNVTADRKRNLLILSAPDVIMPIAEELIEQLDSEEVSMTTDQTVRVRPLSFASAEEVTTGLNGVLNEITSDATGEPLDVRLIATPSSNAIIIMGSDADLKQAEQLIAGLDAEPASGEEITAETFRLDHADAAAIAPMLSKLLTNQQANDPRVIAQRIRSRRGDVNLSPTIQVEPDVRTNSLIVSGSSRTVQLARVLIEELDREEDAANRIVESVMPKNADAAQLVGLANQLKEAGGLGSSNTQLDLFAEPGSGSIVLVGNEENVATAKALLEKWDSQTPAAIQMDLKIISLQHAETNVVAEAVNSLIRDQSTWPTSLQRLANTGRAVVQPTVIADEQNRRVVIAAPQELVEIAATLVSRIDVAAEANAAVDMRVFNLKNADAAQAATAVQQSLAAQAGDEIRQQAATVTAETSSNSIIASGTAEQLRSIESIVQSLDAGVDPVAAQVRTLPLKNARAEMVAPIIEDLLTENAADGIRQMPRWMQYQFLESQQGESPPVRVVADMRLNAVVISASASVLDVAEALVSQLDVSVDEQDGRVDRQLRVLSLRNVAASEVVTALQEVFGSEDESADPLPTITASGSSNSLLIRATEEQFATIEGVVTSLDRAAIGSSQQMMQIPIDPAKADARQVAETLQRMMRDSRGESDDAGKVEVMTLEELMERTKEAAENGVEDLSRADDQNRNQIQSRDREGADIRRFAIDEKRDGYAFSKVIGEDCGVKQQKKSASDTLSNRPCTLHCQWDSTISTSRAKVACSSQDSQDSHAGETPVPPSVHSPSQSPSSPDDPAGITIAIDEATNTLIVLGPPREVERVQALAEMIQTQLPSKPGKMRYIAFPESVDAAGVADLVNNTINKLMSANGERGAMAGRVAIVADPTGNALVIAANDADFKVISELLIAMANPPSTQRLVVKVYPLTRITAERAEESVRDLIGAPSQNNRGRNRGRQTERMQRTLELQLRAAGKTTDAIFDPNLIRVSSDKNSNSLIVIGPDESIGFIDEFVALIDQQSQQKQASLKLFKMKHADAADLQRPIRNILDARYDSLEWSERSTTIEPEVEVDGRTNTLLITASPESLSEAEALIAELDVDLESSQFELRIVELQSMSAGPAAELLQRAVLGDDQNRKTTMQIVAVEEANALLVRASDEVNAEIDAVLGHLDADVESAFPVQTITLVRANAESVATTIQRLYDDRQRLASANRQRNGNGNNRNRGSSVVVVGDQASKSLLVAASPEDFAEIQELVKKFDSQEAAGLEFEIYSLKHAKAQDIAEQVESLVNTLTWSDPFYYDPWSNRGRTSAATRDALAVTVDQRMNSLIVTGEGDKFSMVEKIITALDTPLEEGAERLVRFYHLRSANLELVANVIRESLSIDIDNPRRRWQPRDPNELAIQMDERANALIIAATGDEHDRIAELIKQIDSASTMPDQQITVLPIEFVPAQEMADNLSRFLENRAIAQGQPKPTAVIVANESANNLAVSANEDDLAMIRDLLSQLDTQMNDDRKVNVIALRKARAWDVARIMDTVFESKGGKGVQVTADTRSNSVVISAPNDLYATALEMIETIDSPPPSERMTIRTYSLEGAQADEVVALLTNTLELDEDGEASGVAVNLEEIEGDAVQIDARVTADRRSNSLVVRATPESFPVIEALIERFDSVEMKSPTEWRIIKLNHALAYDVYWTLRDFLRGLPAEAGPVPSIDYNEEENQLMISATPDQFKQIEGLLTEIDIEREQPVTEFIKLKFADAEVARDALGYFYGKFAPAADTPAKIGTRIVANAATNSLLISSEEAEWGSIRSLLDRIDVEEFDPSLQLKVIPLKYADAVSVAQAINDAFQNQVGDNGSNQQQQNNQNEGDDGQRRDAPNITQLVEVEDWVKASAEPMTNTVVVSASRPNLKKIETIVAEIDNLEFAQGPPPRLIAVNNGSPEQFAASLREVYETSAPGRRGRSGGNADRNKLKIVANEASSTIIVRAEEDEFTQIQTLAEALQSEASTKGLSVQVITLTSAPAARVERAIREAFAAKAEQTDQPLSIQSDTAGNSLIIASTASMFEEIQKTVDQLDALQPAAGQGIFIIELENIDPETATEMIETIGLDEPQDEESVSKLVTEPIRISPLKGRNAIIVLANPADRETIIGIMKALDAQPEFGTAEMRIVRLKNSNAWSIGNLLNRMLNPDDQATPNSMAAALQEQMRRLSLRSNDNEASLDLTKPIQIVVDGSQNALLISSTTANLKALEEIVKSLDQLPISDAVVVQIFPLENIDVEDFQRIISDLFDQGKALGNLPLVDQQGVPESEAGKALMGEIAMTIDNRTNTIIVAGTEESVAFVRVMKERLDSQVEIGWVEPRIIHLEHANAADLAETIQAILIDGADNLPQSTPLQNQIGRIRSSLGQNQLSDVFVPMTRLVVRAEKQLNALVIVGTKSNIDVIQQLITLFDTPELAPDAKIRIYPVEHASASRLAGTLTTLFNQQMSNEQLREEDSVIIEADERTNALVVSTSESSFKVVESLLETLDAEVAPELAEIRRIEVVHASATRLEGVIQELMDARLERLQRVDPEFADLEKASIIADPRTNSLIIAASNDAFGVIETLLKELDSETALADGDVQIIKLDGGNGERLAEVIDQVMERKYAEMPAEVRNSQQPLVLVDQRTNSLLVTANPEDFAAIQNLVTTLEATELDPLVAITVLPLETKQAEELAPRIQRLMRERMETLGDAKTDADRVTIEADPSSNSLIVSAPPEHLASIKGLVNALVEAENAAPTFEIDVINLARTNAADIIDVIDEMYVAAENEKRGPDTIRVSADDRLNALLVSAPEQDIRRIRNLVSRLEGTETDIFEIQTIPLTSADPLEIVGLVEEVLRGPGIGGRRNADQAVVFKLITDAAEEDGVLPGNRREMDEVELTTAIRESISLVPDRRTNSVIVTAPRESMELIRTLIEGWDQSETGNLQLRVFNLVNADADATAEILEGLFRTPEREVLVPVNQPGVELPPDAFEGMDAPLPGYGATELTTVPDERKQLSITVDSRTNSIIVAGTPRYLDLVEQVVEELDGDTGNERQQIVYPLKNAVAEDVARVVSEFVDSDQAKLIATLPPDQRGSASRLLEREVTIVGDQKSNTLLVSASPRYANRVREMIEQLDVDPPQVLIQVLLAEITIDSGDEWGVDFRATAGVDSLDVSAGYGLASAFLTGVGVPNLSIAGTDFDLLLRALETQGRLQVLSNPSIMAANNEEANIQIGETIRVPSNLVSSGISNERVEVEAVDLGVILNVTPTINPDGFVRLEINPEISNLSARETQLSEDFSSPVITVRRADTTVTVMDGQTIVLGGLISDRLELREEAVPLLSDLPILGKLFRSKSEQRAKTELLIVLTPHVITSPAHTNGPRPPRIPNTVESITDGEIDRLTVPDMIKDQIREGELEGSDTSLQFDSRRHNRLNEMLRGRDTHDSRYERWETNDSDVREVTGEDVETDQGQDDEAETSDSDEWPYRPPVFLP